MYLLLDIGNTREKAALIKSGKVTALPQLAPDNLAKLPIKAVYFASVASQEKVAAIKQQLGLDHLPWRQVYSEAKACGVSNSYQQPQMLGVDRWLAMLGTELLFPAQHTLIVDAGTAVTIDWLAQDGQHGGGDAVRDTGDKRAELGIGCEPFPVARLDVFENGLAAYFHRQFHMQIGI